MQITGNLVASLNLEMWKKKVCNYHEIRALGESYDSNTRKVNVISLMIWILNFRNKEQNVGKSLPHSIKGIYL